MVDLSVIIPVYNEEDRSLAPNLNLVNTYLLENFKNFELIVVNDGSTDNTQQTLEKMKKRISSLKIITYTPNKGKGFALKTGVLASQGKKLILLDADLPVPLHFIAKAVQLLKDYDLVFGSRLAPGAKIIVKQPFFRRIFGLIFNKLVHHTFELKVAVLCAALKLLIRK